MSFQNKNKISRFVLQYRWLIVVCLSIFVFIVEYFEHVNFGENLFGGGFLWETLVFGVLVPISGGLLLSLINDRSKISSILARIDRQRTLKNALLSARDWDELLTIISQIPHTIFPTLFGDALYLYDPELDKYVQISSWMSIAGKFPEEYTPGQEMEASFVNRHSANTAISKLYRQFEVSTPVQKLVSYTLPLIHLNDPIATLQLLFLEEDIPDDEGLLLLIELSVDITLAIQSNQNQSDLILSSTAARAERQRIARQLHDTLAQDLAFLRLKLEQLLYDDRSSNSEFGNELFRLYKTADHSYEQVRSSLRSIEGDSKLEFTTALYESASIIAENSNFQIEFVQEGSPAELPVDMQRKILYVMREVLRNIGKHAHAKLTKINIQWENDCIQIVTTDNGTGFNVDMISQEKETYGLNIIEEVVAELQGRFDLQSTENDGTIVRFWFPISG